MELLVILMVALVCAFTISFIKEQMRLRKEEKERLNKRLYQLKG